MQDWANFKLKKLCKAKNEETLIAVLAEIRDWAHINLSVKQEQSEDNRFNLIKGKDILDVPEYRWDRLFLHLKEQALHYKSSNDHLAEITAYILAYQGLPNKVVALGSLLTRYTGIGFKQTPPSIWLDDGIIIGIDREFSTGNGKSVIKRLTDEQIQERILEMKPIFVQEEYQTPELSSP